MKKLPHNRYLLLLLSSLTSLLILTACGGSTNETSNSSTTASALPSSNASPDPVSNLQTSDTSQVNQMPSFQPTFGVAALSDANNAVVASNQNLLTSAADLATFNKKASQEATVSGFIVKYKDEGVSSSLGSAVFGAAANSELVTAKGLSNGGLSPSAMVSALGQAAAPYGVTLRFRANAVGNATALASNSLMTLEKANQVASAMKASNPNIAYIEPDIRMQKTSIQNDTYFGDLWALKDNEEYGVRAESAWAQSTGQNVVVAVVDTGITPHVDLIDNTLPGADMISTPWIANDRTDSLNLSIIPNVNTRDNDASDPGDFNFTGQYCGNSYSSWHGSHVAGTIAAKGNNSTGIVGVAYDAKILPVRVLGRCGGDLSDVAAGIVWAAGGHVDGVTDNPPANRAKVINLSLGGGSSSCSATFKYAIDFARSQGAIVVVAAGNESTNAIYSTPANCANAITVGSNGKTGLRSTFSNYGPLVDISAPGEGILSTVDQSYSAASVSATAYDTYQGTSMATPHVSAVFALMFAKNPNLTLEEAETLINLYSGRFANDSQMALIGTGIANAYNVLNAMENMAAVSSFPSRGSFNADTKSDFFWRNQAGNYNQMSLLGSGTMTTSNVNISSSSFRPTASDVAMRIDDFDGDGKSDVAWKRPNPNGLTHTVYLTHMNGEVHSGTTLVPKTISNTFALVATGNFGNLKSLISPAYNNLKADLYFRNNATGQGFFCLFTSSSNQAMTCTSTFTLAAGLNLLNSTDFNNDGFIDMLFRNPTTGAMYIAYNTNRVTVMTAIGTLPLTESFVGVGDYDADGKADLLFRNTSSSFLSVASNPASNYLNLSVSNFGVPSYRSILKSGDYNGDGKDDLVLRDNYTGAVSFVNLTVADDQVAMAAPVKLGTVSNFFKAVY